MSEDNGNHKPEAEKTAEQIASERFARYQKNPESFTEHTDIIACFVRSPRGPMIMIKGSQVELECAWAQLNLKIMNALRGIEIKQAEMAKASTIQKPGSMPNFARRIMGK
jgi:hypothetical protein